VTTRHAGERARIVSAARNGSAAPSRYSTRTSTRTSTSAPARPTARPAAHPTARPTRRPPFDPPRSRPSTTGQRKAQRTQPDPRRPRTRPRTSTSPTRPNAWSGGNFQRRVRLIRLVMVLALLLLVGRLVDVQVVHSSSYQAAAAGESSTSVSLTALRGGIFARDGSPLAMSVPTDDVIADDFQVAHPQTLAASLSPLIGVPVATLADELHRHSGYVVLARQLSQSTGSKISALAFPGITLVADSKRIVTNGNLASPVLGFTNANGGAAGLEYGDNKLLAGTPGKETIIESPSGVALPSSPVTDKVSSRAGTGVELTLDTQLQYETEQVLAKEIISSQSLSGTVVAMDVKTGQILSMANLVSTHPDAPVLATAPTPATTSGGVVAIGPKDAVNEAPSNLALTKLYEPGSVFKLVTFSAALQDGLINPNTEFSVPDQITLDGSVFHDADPHPTEELSATQILAQSSNIGTSEIATDLGEQRLLSQVKNLGFGTSTGLDFPGESPGLLATASQWEPTDYVSLPIGQVDAVNAMQVLDAYNAVANGGVYVQPKLVQATVSPTGVTTATPASSTHRAFSAPVDSALTSMLEQVVVDGTGTTASVPGYVVAGKTGTAQIPTQGEDAYTAGAYMASFVGFAPANNPTISIIVVLDRPTPIFGGTVAAPVFSQIMSYALHRYDIPTTPGVATKPASTTESASAQAQDIT
jgi:cell division protein FtsI (penicillin-binding protein 3)